jgi:hypothetical protein
MIWWRAHLFPEVLDSVMSSMGRLLSDRVTAAKAPVLVVKKPSGNS